MTNCGAGASPAPTLKADWLVCRTVSVGARRSAASDVGDESVSPAS